MYFGKIVLSHVSLLRRLFCLTGPHDRTIRSNPDVTYLTIWANDIILFTYNVNVLSKFCSPQRKDPQSKVQKV